MSTTISIDKTDFIKFNVSPMFKKLISRRAASAGLTLSELGRMLFGWYLHNLTYNKTDIFKMAETAEKNYQKGIGNSFKSEKEAVSYLEQLI